MQVLYANIKAGLGAQPVTEAESQVGEMELSHRARQGHVQSQKADELSPVLGQHC